MTLKASTIADMAADLGIERVGIVRNEFWYLMTFGPLAYRQVMQIDPEWDEDTLKAKLIEVSAPKAAQPEPTHNLPETAVQEPVRRKPGRPRKEAAA